MSSAMEQELYRAAALTFEQLGFVFPAPECECEYADSPVTAAAGVTFTGPFDGRLVVTIRGDLLPSIAANILGMQEEPSVGQQRDALCEITNVICGNVLPKIGGVKEIFRIQSPELIESYAIGSEVSPTIACGASATAETRVPLDEGMAELSLYITNARSLSGDAE